MGVNCCNKCKKYSEIDKKTEIKKEGDTIIINKIEKK